MDRPSKTVSDSSSCELISTQRVITEFVYCVQGPDILHPYASLEWTKCSGLPVDVSSANAVWLENKLFVFEIFGAKYRLYIYTRATDEWSTLDTPVCNSTLVTYRSKLVLVGGEELNGSVTNKLFTMISLGQWRETIPPMIEERSGATAVEYAGNILVAGGCVLSQLSTTSVEVYNGLHWTEAQCLCKLYCTIRSVVFNGQWYLMESDNNDNEVCYAPLDSLIPSSQVSEKPVPTVWKSLTDIPAEHAIPAVVGNRLIAMSDSVYAYSPHTQSWVIVGKMPFFEVISSVVFIPSKMELMVICLCNVYRANLKGTITVVCVAYP